MAPRPRPDKELARPQAPIRRALLASFALVLLAAGAWLAYAKPLPEAHQLARAARLHHPLDEVWAAVLDLGGQAAWRTDLAGMERQPDVRGHEVWREIPKSGPAITWETVEILKDRRQVRCVVDQGAAFGGCVTVEIIRRDDGAIVTIAEKLTVHSRLFRFTHTVAGRREGLDAWLTALGRKFGEEPLFADLPKDLRDPPKPKEEAEGAGVLDVPAEPKPAAAPAP